MKIVTTSIEKYNELIGWKVYLNGEKFPKKPLVYYHILEEKEAIKQAMEDFRACT